MYTRRSKNKVVRRRPQRSRKRIRVLGSTGGKWASETTAADRRRCDQLNARSASFTLLRDRVWQRSLTGAAFVRSAARPPARELFCSRRHPGRSHSALEPSTPARRPGACLWPLVGTSRHVMGDEKVITRRRTDGRA